MTSPLSFNEDFQRDLALDWGIDPTPGAVRDAAWRRIQQAHQYKVMSSTPENSLGIYTEFLKSPYLDNSIDAEADVAEQERLEGVRTDVLTIMEEIQSRSTELTPTDLSKLMSFSIEDLRWLQLGEVIDIDRFAQLQYDAGLVTQLQADQQAELEARIERRVSAAESLSGLVKWTTWSVGGRDAEVTPEQIEAIRQEETTKFQNELRGRADLNFLEELDAWEAQRKEEILNETYGNRAYEAVYGPRVGATGPTIAEQMFGSSFTVPERNYSIEDVSALVETSLPSDVTGDETQERLRTFLEYEANAPKEWDEEMQAQLDREMEEMAWTIRESDHEGAVLQRRGATEAIFGGLGKLMSGVVTPFGWAAWAYDRLPGTDFRGPLGAVITPYDMIERWGNNDAERALREYQDSTNVPDQERIERALLTSAEREWETMRYEDPEALQEWIAMAGNETMAMGMFIGEVRDNEAWKTATEQMLADEDAMQEATLKALQETDFSFANSVMNVAMNYGHKIDKLSTSVMIGLTDKDVWDDLTNREFNKAWTHIQERGSDLGWTPSGVFGLDGSAIGLTMDLGLGIAFDPLTWLAGPTFKGATRGAALGTIDGAMRIAKSPTVRLLSRELVNIARSPQRSAGAFYMASSWLSQNARSRILAIGGFTQEILPRLAAGKGWKSVRGAHEVGTAWVRRLLDDIPEYLPDELDDLADNLANNNFEKPLVVTVARPSSGMRATVQLTDGIKRLLAAEKLGLDRVPVVLRVVDDTPLFLESHLPALRDMAAGRHVKNASGKIDDTTDAQVLDMAERFEGTRPMPDPNDPDSLAYWEDFQNFKPMTAAEQNLFDAMEEANRAGAPESTQFAMSERFHEMRRDAIVGAPVPEEVGSFVNKAGNTHTVKRTIQHGREGQLNTVYYAVDDAGEVVASMLVDDTTISTGSKIKQTGLMEGIARVAHQNGDYVLFKSGASLRTSKEAALWGKGVAKKWLKQSDEYHQWSALDEVIDGDELKELLGEANRGLGEVQTRPESLLPDKALGLDLDAEIMDIVREDIMNGTRPSDGARALLNSSLRDRVTAAVQKLPDPLTNGAMEVRKFFTQGNVTSYVDLHSPEAITDIIHQALKVFGSDMDTANVWIAKLLDYEMEAARKTRAWNHRAGMLDPLIKKVEALKERTNVWDNELSAMDTGLDLTIGGKAVSSYDEFVQAYDDLTTRTAAAEARVDALGEGGGFMQPENLERVGLTPDEARRLLDENPTELSRRAGFTEEEIADWEEYTQLTGRDTGVDDLTREVAERSTTDIPLADSATDVQTIWDSLQAERRGTQTALDQARRNREQLTAARREAIDELEAAQKRIEAEVGRIPDQTELAQIVEEMYEDFNRKHIVPRWAKEIKARPEILDAEKGIVKWEEMQKLSMWSRRHRKPSSGVADTGFFTDDLKTQAKELGIDNPAKLERLYRQVNGIAETKMGLNLPMSPLDMIAASSLTGSKWIKWNQHMTVEGVRNFSNATLKVWMIDKVLRPATAATVSADELLRIFHKGGKWAVDRYIQDRLLFAQARTQNRLHGGSFFERDAVRKGAQWSPRVQERLRQLDEYTTKMREWERMWYDDFGTGWTDIFPDDPIHLDAAKQWTANMMQQSGFRAFLKGRDEFRDWFFSRDGAHIRNGTVLDLQKGRTYPLTDWEKAYDGWTFMFDEVIMAESKAKGTYDDVIEMWRDTARQIDERGGKAIDMPEEVYQSLGAVRGVQKHTKHKFNPLRATDTFFDRFFMDPVQYRRGFVADMVGKQEKARLLALFKSQGKRVVSDFEIEKTLNLKGLDGYTGSGSGIRHLIHKEALDNNMVPMSYIDELVQRQVNAEMDHMLYVAERGSRAGQAVRSVFPFGKPFADMAAFWGREMIRRPHYRSQFIEQNVVDRVGNLGEHFGALRATSALSNVNLRTPALMSRLAATDFTIDRGWDGGLFSGLPDDARAGLVPGTEQTDLSPLLFLPTEGENVFYSVVPGVGYIPMWLLDRVMVKMSGDPQEDPERYREVVDMFGEFIGGAHFGSPDMGLSAVQRVLGGGTLSTMFSGALDIDAMAGGGGHPYWNTTLGQPDREIDRSRIASALLANPDEWAELEGLTSADDINTFITNMANTADFQAGLGNLIEQGSRWLLPTSNKYSGDLDTIWDVWVDVGMMDPRLLGYNTDYDDDTASPEQRLDFARKVRSRYFDLSQASRDALIAANPQIAVNLVSSWEWTDEAHSAGVAEGIAYRTGGSQEALDRHWLYIREGYIRPLAPEERIRRVIGLVLNARESTAKGIYTSAAENWNTYQWENFMSPQDLALLEGLYNDHAETWKEVGIESAEELWRSWGTYEEQAEFLFAEWAGVEPVRGVSTRQDDLTPFDIVRREIVKIDTKPWSETWPGNDLEGGPSERMANLHIAAFADVVFDEVVQEQAEALGVSLDQVLTGHDLWSLAQQQVIEIPRTLQLQVDPAYQSYVGSRTLVGRAVDENLLSIKDDRRFAPEYREQVDNFIQMETAMNARYREAPLGIPQAQKLEVQQAFMNLIIGAEGSTLIDFEQLWELGFEHTYGTLGWTPDDPRSPYGDNGQPVAGAWQPYILDVIDGDSMKIRSSPHGETFEVRLLGVRARDYGIDDDGAREDKARLNDVLQQAIANDDMIWLVREPDKYGNVDMFGRELAWLWIGDSPFFFPDELLPDRDPTGPDFVDPFGGDQ